MGTLAQIPAPRQHHQTAEGQIMPQTLREPAPPPTPTYVNRPRPMSPTQPTATPAARLKWYPGEDQSPERGYPLATPGTKRHHTLSSPTYTTWSMNSLAGQAVKWHEASLCQRKRFSDSWSQKCFVTPPPRRNGGWAPIPSTALRLGSRPQAALRPKSWILRCSFRMSPLMRSWTGPIA